MPGWGASPVLDRGLGGNSMAGAWGKWKDWQHMDTPHMSSDHRSASRESSDHMSPSHMASGTRSSAQLSSGTTWTTRPETLTDAADRAAVRAVNLAAFPAAHEADLVDALRDDPAWIPGLSIVAEAPDGTVVGHALLTRCRVGEAPALALAPVAVAPEYQRTGAGSAAVRAALDAARELGGVVGPYMGTTPT